MISALNTSSVLLESHGLTQSVDGHLLRAKDRWRDAPEFRSHGHALRRLFIDLEIDAILCVDNRPAVCLKDARLLSDHQIESLRRKLWNLGATTLLVLETKHQVQVYSTIKRPVQKDLIGYGAQLSTETINDLEIVALALKLGRLLRRVETGSIYREHKSLFESHDSVNRHLLANLKELRNLITSARTPIAYRRAHAFIGRFLLSCYLLDRGIIGPRYLEKNAGLSASDMLGVLDGSNNGGETLQVLFNALHRDFNGSLFGDIENDFRINNSEVNYLKRFLAGENLRTGQLSLFKLYDFAFVPVELISSIYEEFLGTEADAEALQTSRRGASKHGQRAQGAYYTPPRLAELAIDVATKEWDTLLDKRCLDPACGSGVFLVILFIRMAEEWRMRNPDASTQERYDALMRLLSENLSGIDVHPTACLIACFSLYLAFLDQMDPKEIIELREALAQNTNKKLLPKILWEREKPRPRPPHFATVREYDFFSLLGQPEFDLVIGNPPWISRKPASEVENWLFSRTQNPHLYGVPKAEQSQTMFPAKEVACAFMWKAAMHLLDNGRVCQVLPSRVLLSNNTNRFQAVWFEKHKVECLWLLVDWSFILFPTADCPCFVVRYERRHRNDPPVDFDFITPKVELLDPREGIIPVLPEDRKSISPSKIISAALDNRAAVEWKKHHWGTPRDLRLIDRLLTLPRLKDITRRPPRDPSKLLPDRRHVWLRGQGFQPATASTTAPKKVFWNEDDLFLGANVEVADLILRREDCTPIGHMYEDEGLHRKRSPLIYKGPLVLINKACTKFLFSAFDVLFQDDFLSISAPKHEENELLFLTAVFSSPVAQYLLFHTTSNMGVERDIARTEEILQLPFPTPEQTADPVMSEAVIQSCAQTLRKLMADLSEPQNFIKASLLIGEAKTALHDRVYEYFNICPWERYLIEDTVNVFRPSSTPGSAESTALLTAVTSSFQHRKGYANTLIDTFRGWSRTNKRFWAKGKIAQDLGLGLVTMGVGDVVSRYSETAADENISALLENLRDESTEQRTSSFEHLRGFAMYESDKVHLLKPLHRRYWTRTAALNDADEILVKMMEDGGWRD